eukprot:1060865-Amphidinium_carterae.1
MNLCAIPDTYMQGRTCKDNYMSDVDRKHTSFRQYWRYASTTRHASSSGKLNSYAKYHTGRMHHRSAKATAAVNTIPRRTQET